VTMVTASRERYEAVVADCPAAARHNLVHSTEIKDGSDCDCWVVGRFLSAAEQAVAPAGTTFHQFVVPPLDELRKDCRCVPLPHPPHPPPCLNSLVHPAVSRTCVLRLLSHGLDQGCGKRLPGHRGRRAEIETVMNGVDTAT